ncbi:MAG: HEAT repeat domain-containing protein, partial [Bdellovibrionota bacterium]
LGLIGEAAAPAVPALTKALKDKDYRVRNRAAEALARIDKKNAEAVNESWLRRAAKGIIRLIQFKEK